MCFGKTPSRCRTDLGARNIVPYIRAGEEQGCSGKKSFKCRTDLGALQSVLRKSHFSANVQHQDAKLQYKLQNKSKKGVLSLPLVQPPHFLSPTETLESTSCIVSTHELRAA